MKNVKVRMLPGNRSGVPVGQVRTYPSDIAKDWIQKGWCVAVEEEEEDDVDADVSASRTVRVRRGAVATVLLLVATLFSPATYAADRFEVVASAAQVSTGNSATFKVPTRTMMFLGVDVTAVSGTTPQLDVWVQVSDDGGTTWYDAVADITLKSNGSIASSNTVNSNVRDCVDVKVSTTAEQFGCVYKVFPSDTFRLRWVITGTTPSFTFSSSVVLK